MMRNAVSGAPDHRPASAASATPEARGLARDEVRMLVSHGNDHIDSRFSELASFLRAGDVLVVNRSATLPAALEAHSSTGRFLLDLCTRYGDRLWLAEPRWSTRRPGPIPLSAGDRIVVAGAPARALGPYPGIPRLQFMAFEQDPLPLLERHGQPIRYGYLSATPRLEDYQTIFSDRPGSAEMPSAARPFTARTMTSLERAGATIVKLTLHTGVSSLESDDLVEGDLYPEPFELSATAAAELNAAHNEQRRIIAVGTTAVRALASSWSGRAFRAARGMTRIFIRPGIPVPPLAGLLTGFHDSAATHLAMLEAVAGQELVVQGYRRARAGGYLWHEFGDVHLLLPDGRHQHGDRGL